MSQSIDLANVSATNFNGSQVDAINLNGTEIWTGTKPFSLWSKVPDDNIPEKCLHSSYQYSTFAYSESMWVHNLTTNYHWTNAGSYSVGAVTVRLRANDNKVCLTYSPQDYSGSQYSSANSSVSITDSYKVVQAFLNLDVSTAGGSGQTTSWSVSYHDSVPTAIGSGGDGSSYTRSISYDNMPVGATDCVSYHSPGWGAGIVYVSCTDTRGSNRDFQTVSNQTVDSYVGAVQIGESNVFDISSPDVWGMSKTRDAWNDGYGNYSYSNHRISLTGFYQNKYYNLSYGISASDYDNNTYTTPSSLIAVASPSYTAIVNTSNGVELHTFDSSGAVTAQDNFAQASGTGNGSLRGMMEIPT
jgi:hypothetical protein